MLGGVITRLLHIDKLREKNNMTVRFEVRLNPSYFSELSEDTTTKFGNELW